MSGSPDVRFSAWLLSLSTLACGAAAVATGAVVLADTPTADAAASRTFYNPQVGQRHPDFTLPTISDRQPVSLSQFRGKKVLLIHFASW